MALVMLALVGLVIHYIAHLFFVPDRVTKALTFDGSKFMASLLGFVDVFVVTGLFLSRRTAVYGYLLNGMIVILGTILMSHFAIASFIAKGIPPEGVILGSNAIDITLAWADFLVGRALYEVIMQGERAAAYGQGRG